VLEGMFPTGCAKFPGLSYCLEGGGAGLAHSLLPPAMGRGGREVFPASTQPDLNGGTVNSPLKCKIILSAMETCTV
jgi:hypothetical protein